MTDEQFKWYKALRYGDVIGEGPTPPPDEIMEQATEIRWSMGDEANAPVTPAPRATFNPDGSDQAPPPTV